MRTMFIIVLMIFTHSCGAKKESFAESDGNKTVKKSAATIRSKIFTLKTQNNIIIGDVYAEMINDSIFTKLQVCHGNDTIYWVDSTGFSNRNGEDLQVLQKGFFGYKVVLKRGDYFVLSYLTNGGKNVSDDITVEWNGQHGMLEVQKAP